MKFAPLYFWLIVAAMSCSTQKQLVPDSNEVKESIEKAEEEVYTIDDDEYTEERTLDELVISAPRGYELPKYNPSDDLPWDLIHMDLDVRFDWVNESVFGRAELELTPTFYSQEFVTLDAKGFEIYDVSDQDGSTLSFEYDDLLLTIALSKSYEKGEELVLTIDYVARPSESAQGGSAAITSDQGLFFINPRNEIPNKPRQIWTQGETEHNSRWFPTFDQPNERMTHDIRLTVEDQFVTLSNGYLVSSKNNADSTRTDHWKMDQPHAPYLVMIAVGDFAVEREQIDDILLEYYVEKDYAPYAKQIFAHTPEMITFFSDLLNYPYPWNKYSQIITKDYVSGAMENTTAVIYGDFIQKTDRELIDNSNDYIVAHELFHHWFGDLVTTESWANLTLQEGFANYAEHLWQEYKYGKDAAGYQRKNERQGYLSSIIQTGIHPLIFYGYDDKEQMFDGHSYNKGGLVLHMLRHLIGDDAFYAGLHKFLKDNAYQAVEVDELRMAFEDVIGQDLNWFFNQWYLEAGHPDLTLSYSYDSTGFVKINVEQKQDPDQSTPIFQLPVTVSVFDQSGSETQFDFFIDERNNEIILEYSSEPALIVFDRYDHLLFTKQESKTTAEYMNQYKWVDTYIHRFEAINKFKNKKDAQPIIKAALNDKHFSIRKIAVENVRIGNDVEVINALTNMVKNDKHSSVRSAALKRLNGIENVDYPTLLQEVLESEQSYVVVGSALEMMSRLNPELALKAASALKKEPTDQLASAISKILSNSGEAKPLDYFRDRASSVSLFSVFNFYNSYYTLVSQLESTQIIEEAQSLYAIATDSKQHMFYRFAATNMVFQLSNSVAIKSVEASQELKEMIVEIKAIETNPTLRSRYSSF